MLRRGAKRIFPKAKATEKPKISGSMPAPLAVTYNTGTKTLAMRSLSKELSVAEPMAPPPLTSRRTLWQTNTAEHLRSGPKSPKDPAATTYPNR